MVTERLVEFGVGIVAVAAMATAIDVGCGAFVAGGDKVGMGSA